MTEHHENFETIFNEVGARFQDLTAQALRIKGPLSDLFNKLLPTLNIQTSSEDSRFKSIFYKLYNFYLALYAPLRTISISEALSRLGLSVVVILVEIAALVAVVITLVNSTFHSSLLAQENGANQLQGEIWIWVILYAALLPGSLVRWERLLRKDHKVVGISLVVLIVTVILAICFIPYWLPRLLNSPQINFSIADVVNGYKANIDIILVVLLFLFPSITMLLTMTYDILLWFAFTLWRLFEGFVFFHTPFSMRQIRSLGLDEIVPIDPNRHRWHLRDVSANNINALIDLAKSNREGTAHRLLPITILLASLQVVLPLILVVLQSNNLDIRFPQLISNNYGAQPGDFLIYIVAGIGASVALVMLGVVVDMLRNIYAQSIVIEACIITKNSLENRAAILLSNRLVAQVELTTDVSIKAEENMTRNLPSLNNWAAIAGNWKLMQDQQIYLDQNPQLNFNFGIALCSARFRSGAISVRIDFSQNPRRNEARIIFGYNSLTRSYFSAGIGGYGNAYAIDEFVDGRGWQRILALGNRDSIDETIPHNILVRVNGQQVSLLVDDVLVAQLNLGRPLFGDQVGLLAVGPGQIGFTDFSISSTSPRAFVVMQYGEPYDSIYSQVIAPVCKEMNLEAFRADDIHRPGVILQDIIAGIVESEVVIAEITPANPNVFYELGYSHAFSKHTILLAERDKKLPFDVSGYRCIFYDNTIRGKQDVEIALRNHLESILTGST